MRSGCGMLRRLQRLCYESEQLRQDGQLLSVQPPSWPCALFHAPLSAIGLSSQARYLVILLRTAPSIQYVFICVSLRIAKMTVMPVFFIMRIVL